MDLRTCGLADLRTCGLVDLRTCGLVDLQAFYSQTRLPKVNLGLHQIFGLFGIYDTDFGITLIFD